ncbi:MAG: ABC transporter ATP-binding protein [Anaerolineaceae bacterium]|nr:ABC transporter ATP-binding protein [Anaerolineaceae bacterium]
MATLEILNVTKRFGRKVIAVDDISLEVHDQEFLVLLGPSGCGKTTTMRMVAGLEEVTEGTILIDGVDVTDLPPRKRNISMVFQNYAIWPHMTVFENIAYALRLKHMAKSEIDRIVREVAGMTNIGEYLERLPAQLSGGQQQRVAVARAIAVSPKVFLMDEPLSNLDAKLRVSMRTELKAIHASAKATTVFVTHDQSEAMSIADRIVIMRDGKIIQTGTPEEVYEKSANLFVADFIGTPPTNFFDVTLQKSNGTLHLVNPHFDLSLDAANTARLNGYNKEQLVLGVRPENIVLTSEKDSIMGMTALVVEPQGSHQVIAFKMDEKMVKVVAPSQPKPDMGSTIHLNFSQGTLRFFDPETTFAIGD